MSKNIMPREVALKIIYDVLENKMYSNIAINNAFHNTKLNNDDKKFVTNIAYGVIEKLYKIDFIINKFSKIKLKKISKWILNILRIGIYQIMFLDKVPNFAACNEGVNLAKRYGHYSSKNFVNAILRKVVNEKENITFPERKDGLERFLSINYSYPEWLIKRWIEEFGKDFTEKLMEHSYSKNEFTVRVNTLKINRDNLVDVFKKEGIYGIMGKYVDESLIIKNPVSFEELSSYKEGFFNIQDESSMLVSKILSPNPGEFIIDLCAAPGNKTTHIAQLMNNKGTIIANDIHEHRVELIKINAKRLGIDIIQETVFDSTKQNNDLYEKADRVLIDAPCSGFGTIRKKPEIKYHKTIEDIKNITELQYKLLASGSKYLKIGGVIVYSTCSIEKEENEEQVLKFIENNKNFELDDITYYLPDELKKLCREKGYITIYPHINESDGFFISRIKRIS